MNNMRTVLVVKAKGKSEARIALEEALEALEALDEDVRQKDIEIKVSFPKKGTTCNLVSAWR
jgi:hypothetical protein